MRIAPIVRRWQSIIITVMTGVRSAISQQQLCFLFFNKYLPFLLQSLSLPYLSPSFPSLIPLSLSFLILFLLRSPLKLTTCIGKTCKFRSLVWHEAPATWILFSVHSGCGKNHLRAIIMHISFMFRKCHSSLLLFRFQQTSELTNVVTTSIAN